MSKKTSITVAIIASDCASSLVLRWARLLDATPLNSGSRPYEVFRALRRIKPDIVQVVGIPAEPVAAIASTLAACPAVLSTTTDGPQDKVQRAFHRRFHRFVAESQGHARGFLRENPHIHLGRVAVVARPLGDAAEADKVELEALQAIYRETLAMRTGRR